MTTPDNNYILDFLHLLWVPVIATLGWFYNRLDDKVDKEELKSAIDNLKDTLDEMRHDRQSMHVENAERLEIINRNILDIIGGRYSREDK